VESRFISRYEELEKRLYNEYQRIKLTDSSWI
jgi:hypothetical protein